MDQIDAIRKAQRGNHKAFEFLMKDSELAMYRLSKSMLKNDTECADAIQETILKAYQAIRSLKEPKYFKTWLMRILINECTRQLKHRRQVIPMAVLEERAEASKRHLQIEVWEAVLSLEEELRVVVVLFYMEDMPLKDIASLLDIAEGTVKSRLYRAREKLAYYLGDEREMNHE